MHGCACVPACVSENIDMIFFMFGFMLENIKRCLGF